MPYMPSNGSSAGPTGTSLCIGKMADSTTAIFARAIYEPNLHAVMDPRHPAAVSMPAKRKNDEQAHHCQQWGGRGIVGLNPWPISAMPTDGDIAVTSEIPYVVGANGWTSRKRRFPPSVQPHRLAAQEPHKRSRQGLVWPTQGAMRQSCPARASAEPVMRIRHETALRHGGCRPSKRNCTRLIQYALIEQTRDAIPSYPYETSGWLTPSRMQRPIAIRTNPGTYRLRCGNAHSHRLCDSAA